MVISVIAVLDSRKGVPEDLIIDCKTEARIGLMDDEDSDEDGEAEISDKIDQT